MKNNLSILLAASFFLACHPGKEKKVMSSTTADSIVSTTNVPQNSIYQEPSTDTVVSANRLIVPGKSIGLTSINQKNQEALGHLGEPSTKDAGMGKELATWYSKPVVRSGDTVINEMNIFFTTNMGGPDEASRVSHIRVTSSFFMTSGHIGNGSGLDTIKKYFPGSKKIASCTSPKTNKQLTIYDDSKAGIAFEIDPRQICVGITVHKSQEKAYQTYSTLYSNIQFY